MGAVQIIGWREAAASALEWWQDAGVDTLVDDEMRDWFAPPPPAPAAAAVASAAAAQALAVAEALPETLEAFVTWRTGASAPEAEWNAPWVLGPPRKNPLLMIVADMPEEEDTAESGLLTGVVGTLLDRMLRTVGLSRDDVMLATVAAARPVTGRIPPQAESELARLTRHHVALVQPRHLLLLGAAPCRSILGPDGERGSLQSLNHAGIECRTIASFHPRFLLERPRAKADVWRDLQSLFEETDA